MKRKTAWLLSFILLLCLISPAHAAEPDIVLDYTGDQLTIAITGRAGAPVTVKITRENTPVYLDSLYLDQGGNASLHICLPRGNTYEVAVNLAGTLYRQSVPQSAVPHPGLSELSENTRGCLLDIMQQPQVGSIGGEWAVIGLARSAAGIPGELRDAYYEKASAYIADSMDDSGRLNRNKSTENSRMILSLTAIGRNPADVEGKNLLTALGDMEYLNCQGINGPIWALIALDAADDPFDSGEVTRETLAERILDAQGLDGGWNLGGEKGEASTPDLTAMALIALAPHQKQESVQTAVEKALTWLSGQQTESGDFADRTSEACAQAVIALCSLGIDPCTDVRFVKSGHSLMDGLCSYAVSAGGFRHLPEGPYDQMATEQGYLALTAYDRFVNHRSRIFDMTDTGSEAGPSVPPAEENLQSSLSGGSIAAIVIGGGIGGFFFWKKKKAPSEP